MSQEVIGDLGDEDLWELGESMIGAGELGLELLGDTVTTVESNTKHAFCTLI